jgi:hypothetical protein
MAEIAGKTGGIYLQRLWCLNFTSSQYVTVSDHADLDFGSGESFTVETWFFSSADGKLFEKRNGSNEGWTIEISSDKVVFTVKDDEGTPNTASITSTTSVNDSAWHHLVAFRDRDVDNKLYLYLDGSSDATGVADTTVDLSNANDLLFGGGGGSGGFTGKIGETRILSTYQTAAQVTASYNSGNGVFHDTDSNTAALWHVNEGTGSSIYDRNLTHTGTITNATWVAHTDSVSGEAVGTGDGSDVTWSLANSNVDNVVVYLDAVQQDNYEFWVAVDGEITFRTAPGAGVAITADYDFGIVSECGGFFNWSLDKVGDALDITDFNSAGAREYLFCLQGWTATAERHWIHEGFVWNLGSKAIIRLYVDEANNKRHEGWAQIVGINPTVPVDAIVNEPLTFQGTGFLSYETT